MIKSLVFIAFFFGCIPFLLGLLYTGFVEEDKDNILLHMAAGYVILFGIFEIAALPLIWMRQSLSLLTGIYIGILLALSGLSLFFNWRRLKGILFKTVWAVKGFTLCIWAQLLVLVCQLLFYVRYQFRNADDAFYVAAASTSIATDTIFAYNPYTGAAYESLPSRYVLSPFYAFTAVMAEMTDTHPAILAHSVFMLLFLLLAYAVYALLGRILLSYDMEKTGYFLLLLTALQVFSAYSERTSGLFLLIRLWQGKAVLAGVLLPMLLYLFFRIYMQKEEERPEGRPADWILLFLLLCACCMVSSMGIMLAAVMLGILGILSAWRKQNIRLLAYALLCCMPNIVCAGIYLVIR